MKLPLNGQGTKVQILKSHASKDEKQILEPNIRALHENDEEMSRK